MRITPVPLPPELKWTCPDCGTVNILISSTCSNCNKARGAFQKVDGTSFTVQEVLKAAVRDERARRGEADPNDMNPIPTPEWVCSKCGTRNRITHAFCSNCGNSLIPVQDRASDDDPNDMNPIPTPQWTCSKCGTRNKITHAFCSNCNNPLIPVQGQAGAPGDEDSVRSALRDQIRSARTDALKGIKKPPG